MTACTTRRCESEADALASMSGRPPVPYCYDCIGAAQRRGVPTIVTDLPPEIPAMSSTPPRPALILRPDADNHPTLCRIRDCNNPVQARGLCMSDYSRVGQLGAWSEFARPKMSGSEIARKREAAKRASASTAPPGDYKTYGGRAEDCDVHADPPADQITESATAPVTTHEVPDALTEAPPAESPPVGPVALEGLGHALVLAQEAIIATPRYVPAPTWASRKLAADSAAQSLYEDAGIPEPGSAPAGPSDYADKTAALDEIRRVLAPVLGIGETEDNAQGMVGRVVALVEAQAAEIQNLRDMLGTDGHPSAALNHLGRLLGDAGFGVPDCNRTDCRSVHLNDRIHRAIAQMEAQAGHIARLERAAERLRNQVLLLGPAGCGDEFDTLDEMARRWQEAEDARARAARMLAKCHGGGMTVNERAAAAVLFGRIDRSGYLPADLVVGLRALRILTLGVSDAE